MSENKRVQPVFLCWFICIGSLAAYFWAYNDPVMAVVLGVIGAAGVCGYCVGATVVLASSVVMAFTVMFPQPFESAFGPAIADFFGTSGALNRLLTISIAAVTLSLVAMLLAEIIWNRLLEKRLGLLFYNRSFGLLLGALQAGVVCIGLLGGSVVAEPFAKHAQATKVHTVQDYVRHCTADGIARIGVGTRRSQIYPLLEQVNPFDHLPSLRALSNLSPQARAAILRQQYRTR